MANVMLTSEAAKDPNKPFALRVEDVCAKFDVCATGGDTLERVGRPIDGTVGCCMV